VKELRPYLAILAIMTLVFGGVLLVSCTKANTYKTRSFSTIHNVTLSSYKIDKRIKQAYDASRSILTDIDGHLRIKGSAVLIENLKHKPIVTLTSWHVVKAVHKVQGPTALILVGLKKTGKVVPSFVLAKDEKADLALLVGVIPQAKNGPAVKIAKQLPEIGSNIWLIGALQRRERNVSKCCLSYVEKRKGIQWFITCAANYYGNSGGGLFNQHQEIIGIQYGTYTQSLTSRTPVPGSGVAVALPHIQQLIKKALP